MASRPVINDPAGSSGGNAVNLSGANVAAGTAQPQQAAPASPKPAPKKAAPRKQAQPASRSSQRTGVNAGGYSISASDWSLVQQIASQYKIDPYVLVAIGIHETGWGTQGDGRNGNILGVGSYDSGSSYQWAGLQNQLTMGAQLLSSWGVHTIQDIANGKAAAWATDPHWEAGVVSVYNSVKGTKFTAKTSTATASAQGGAGGGGAGSTAYPSGDPNFGTPQPMSVQQYLDDPQIAQTYGYLAAYMKDPEIGPILAQAAKEGWGQAELFGAISKTKWWKTTAASARAWQQQQRMDPATAQQRLSQMVQQVRQEAASMGVEIGSLSRANQIANAAIAGDWSAQQLQSAIGAEWHYNAKHQGYIGLAGQTISQFKQLSNAYMVPMSDATMQQWTKGVLQGTYKTQDFENYVRDMAKSLFPQLSSALDKGETVQQYLQPYAQLAGQTLEMNPDGINWMDPKWAKAINTTTPDGQRAPMSLSDWGSYLRSLPEYRKTAGATQQAYQFAEGIASTFGKVAQ